MWGSPLDRLAVLVATLFTAVLGGFRLGAPSIWLDEAWSVAIVDPAAGGGGLGLLTSPDLSSMAYYLLLAGWLPVAGMDEALLRSPSLAFAVATVPIVYLVARELFEPVVARLAVLVFATNGMLIEWARTVRGYSLALLLITACFYAYLRAVRGRDRGWWVAWTVLAALSIYAHLISAVVVATQVLLLWWLAEVPAVRRRGVRATAALAALLVPLAVLVLMTGDAQVWWIPGLSFEVVPWFLTSFAGVHTTLFALPATVLSLVGLATLWQGLRAAGPSWRRSGPLVVLVWLVVPVVAVTAVSVVRPMMVPRYLIMLLPALAMTVAVGVARFRSRPAAMLIAVVVLVAASVPLLVTRYDATGREDWRSAVAVIEDGWREGDLIVVDPDLYLIPLDHELAGWSEHRRPVPVQGLQPGDFDAAYRGRPAVVTFERTTATPDATRVWLVVRDSPEAVTSIRAPAGLVTPPGMDDWRLRSTWMVEKVSVALLEAPTGGRTGVQP
jgi:mannosyltransferase